MSVDDVLRVLARASAHPEATRQVLADPASALRSENLSAEEQELIRRLLLEPQIRTAAFMEQDAHDRLRAQTARGIELGNYTVKILRDTLDNAKKTYSLINFMNSVMFGLGILLFIASALMGAIASKTVAAALLGGLGAATFIAMFILGPIKRSQSALSNLVQVEISFMNFFDQITYWSNYALTSDGVAPPPILERVERASETLQKRSEETIKLLQEHVEN